LSWLFPSFWTLHVGNAGGGGRCVDTANVLFDDLRFVSGGFDAGGLRD
jgi:hypothetical protein